MLMVRFLSLLCCSHLRQYEVNVVNFSPVLQLSCLFSGKLLDGTYVRNKCCCVKESIIRC